MSTNAGKASLGFAALALVLLAAGALWGLVTDSEKQIDLASGVLRLSFLPAIIAGVLVVPHHEELRRRGR
ncbi:hypothetical protein [Streptomyces poonensis]|uniref:hypothetical protein n=1 Tax=Streptomyces poonensis TaxID=68255 RepID=UPI00167BA9C0|nr:hypothetical protein [Streptomyces poonensis]